MDMLRDVHDFHQKFGLVDAYASTPSINNKELMEFRAKFLVEEAEEFAEAIRENHLVKAFDALIDIVYVALGTALMMNVPWLKGWQAVHFANMQKVRVLRKEQSGRRSQYDVVKPSGWISPEPVLGALIQTHEFYASREAACHCDHGSIPKVMRRCVEDRGE